MITQAHIIAWLQDCARVFEAQKATLTELDSPIGDADHGINMARGFGKVAEKLPSLAENDISGVLKAVGMTLMSTVGGASGPLYGTFFTRAAAAVAGKPELDGADVLALLEAGADGIAQRGRAVPNDKTMLDALYPAVAAMKAALDGGADLLPALEACVAAAEAGVQATIPLIARKGRSSYLGERSIGHQDPGATSAALLLRALLEAAKA
ncbi:MAG: dihydroxyacetone kinase subunit L [Chloroflexi bacterium]|nr:dihydroxyacetone kinase subunit L [Chloroflexota bacterium]